jgi:hypothetical protein
MGDAGDRVEYLAFGVAAGRGLVLLNRKRFALVALVASGALGSGMGTTTALGAVQNAALGDAPQWWSPAPRTSLPVTPGSAACRGRVGMRLAACRVNQRVARQCGGLRGRWRSLCVRQVLSSNARVTLGGAVRPGRA